MHAFLFMKNILFLLALACTFSVQAQTTFDPSKIDIVRDEFGVPHIFAKTDAEVAYGLEWATAEDDVDNAQFMLSACPYNYPVTSFICFSNYKLQAS